MLFSVLIPTYERSAGLTELLDSWLAVEPPHGGHEIILADDGSRTSPADIVAPYAARMPLRFLQLPHAGPAAARQAALEAASGEMVLLTDDDCRPEAGLLRAYEEGARKHPGCALGGAVVNLLTNNIPAEATQTIVTFVTDTWNSGPGGASFFTTSNLLLPRDGLLAVGGFEQGWPTRTGEDRDLCRRWAESGRRMACVPEAVMGHAHGLTFRKFLRQHFHYGQGRWWTERRRVKDGAGPPAWSGPGFYMDLLASPWGRFSPAKAAWISLLIALAQVATATGSLQARFSSPPDDA